MSAVSCACSSAMMLAADVKRGRHSGMKSAAPAIRMRVIVLFMTQSALLGTLVGQDERYHNFRIEMLPLTPVAIVKFLSKNVHFGMNDDTKVNSRLFFTVPLFRVHS